jgi:hypothetical protein
MMRSTRIRHFPSSSSGQPRWSPQPKHPVLSYTKPFTPASLAAIRDMLTLHYESAPWPTVDVQETHAAVLVPLCNVAGRPGILFEVRGGSLRSHSGEVRCTTFLLLVCVMAC